MDGEKELDSDSRLLYPAVGDSGVDSHELPLDDRESSTYLFPSRYKLLGLERVLLFNPKG